MQTAIVGRVSIVVLVAGLAMTACGEQAEPVDDVAVEAATEPAPGPAPVVIQRDACALLETEELAAAVGEVQAGTPSSSGGAAVCTWTSASGQTVVLQAFPGADAYDRSRETFESFYESTATAVTGLGDAAFFIGGRTSSMPTATVVARAASGVVSVQVMSMSGEPESLRAPAVELARAAIQP